MNRRQFLLGAATAPVAARLGLPAPTAPAAAPVAAQGTKKPPVTVHVWPLDPDGTPIIERGSTFHATEVSWR